VHYRALAILPRQRTTASQTSPRQSRQHLGELAGVGECLASVVGVVVDIRCVVGVASCSGKATHNDVEERAPRASSLLVKPAKKQTEGCSAIEQSIAKSRDDIRVLRLWLARVTSDVVVRLHIRPHYCPEDEGPDGDRPGAANTFQSYPGIVVNCSTITYPLHESLQQIYILHEDISRSDTLLS
jgi:hypothetical protein